MQQSQWLIPIEGRSDHLKLLSEIFSEEPEKIQSFHNGYFLTGGFLDGLTEPAVVIERARDRLELMLGAARIESGDDCLCADLCGIVDRRHGNGSIERTSLCLATISIGSAVRLSFDRPGASRAYVQAAEGCPHLDLAVRLWADSSRTWPRLYRIVEEIYVSFRGEGNWYASEVLFRHGLVDSKELYSRFRSSACEAIVAGKDSRHAMDNNKTPKTLGEPADFALTHTEAVSFVRGCLKRALEHKRSIG